jgi:hypothetical protein
MKTAVETLEKEIDLITRALTEWESKEYPEAKKRQESKLKELNIALEKLKL